MNTRTQTQNIQIKDRDKQILYAIWLANGRMFLCDIPTNWLNYNCMPIANQYWMWGPTQNVFLSTMVNRFVYTQTEHTHTHARTHSNKIFYSRWRRVCVGLCCCLLFPSNFPPLKFQMLAIHAGLSMFNLDDVDPIMLVCAIYMMLIHIYIKYTVTIHRWYKWHMLFHSRISFTQ